MRGDAFRIFLFSLVAVPESRKVICFFNQWFQCFSESLLNDSDATQPEPI